jgi:hypothetical protein
VLHARVGGKDGKPLAETDADHLDPVEASSARALTRPILVDDGSGRPSAIGTIELRLSTKDVEQAAAASTISLAIEGGICVLVCGGLILLSRKQRRPAKPALAPGAANQSAIVAARMSNSKTMPPRDKPAKSPREPPGVQPSKEHSTHDGAVEVALDSPPAADGSH